MVQSGQKNQTCFEGAQCLTCGYDLRGLEIDGSCPECGTSIELSMRGDRLSLSDPAWVAKLAKGQSLLVLGLKIFLLSLGIGFACLMIGFAAPLVLTFVFQVTPNAVIFSWLFSVTFKIMGIGLFIGLVITTIGCALVTTQDPRESFSESTISNRKIARWSLFAFYASFVVCSVLSYVFVFSIGSNISSRIYTVFMFLLLGTCITVSLIANLRWLASLAVRIPNHELGKRTLKSSRFFYWAILVIIIMSQINTLARPAPVAGAPMGIARNIIFEVLSCSSIILVIAILFNSIQLYLILREYRKAFRQCAAEAATANNS